MPTVDRARTPRSKTQKGEGISTMPSGVGGDYSVPNRFDAIELGVSAHRLVCGLASDHFKARSHLRPKSTSSGRILRLTGSVAPPVHGKHRSPMISIPPCGCDTPGKQGREGHLPRWRDQLSGTKLGTNKSHACHDRGGGGSSGGPSQPFQAIPLAGARSG